MPDELKPCPACGGTDVFVMDESDSNIFWVECDNPDCSVHGPWRNSQSDAIAAWNALPRAPQWTEYDGTESTLPPAHGLVLVQRDKEDDKDVFIGRRSQSNDIGWLNKDGLWLSVLIIGDRWMPWPEDR